MQTTSTYSGPARRRGEPQQGAESSARQRMRWVAGLLLLAMVVSLLPACMMARGPRDFENENDRLRRENLELRETVADLREHTAALERAIEAERARAEGPLAELPPTVQPPLVSRITLGRFSGGIDTDGDGVDDAVRLYVNTLDARNRFIPTVGTARVTVAALPPGEDARTIATAYFDAEQFEQAYRSGLAGTHYTLIVPVTDPVPQGIDTVIVRVRLRDLLTGTDHDAEATVRWSGSSTATNGR